LVTEAVVVVGGGQAGLAVSHELTAMAIDHVVLERHRLAQTWRRRWDSFCLVTPNWTMSLPGFPYGGNEPEGFLLRDKIVLQLERYAASFGAPVHEGVDVQNLKHDDDGFVLRTSAGTMNASQVVLATGAYQRPHRPAIGGTFPSGVAVLDAEDYRNPDGLPPGPVLIVGSGQTGCQLAEDLQEADREVFLACGRAPWIPRRSQGRDLVTWLSETDYFEASLSSLPSPQGRLAANVQLSGRDGGHDLNFRVLQAQGVQLLGHLIRVESGHARFAPDLAESVAWGDGRYDQVRTVLREQLPAKGLQVPELPVPEPFRADPPSDLDLRRFGAVLFTSGFRPDYSRWVDVPAFDDLGFPITEDGASTACRGLYFVGVHFLRKRKSSLLFGVGEDAALVAGTIAERVGTRPVRRARPSV
jgi:putative flavoprotein involved in K+ transport